MRPPVNCWILLMLSWFLATYRRTMSWFVHWCAVSSGSVLTWLTKTSLTSAAAVSNRMMPSMVWSVSNHASCAYHVDYHVGRGQSRQHEATAWCLSICLFVSCDVIPKNSIIIIVICPKQLILYQFALYPISLHYLVPAVAVLQLHSAIVILPAFYRRHLNTHDFQQTHLGPVFPQQITLPLI